MEPLHSVALLHGIRNRPMTLAKAAVALRLRVMPDTAIASGISTDKPDARSKQITLH